MKRISIDQRQRIVRLLSDGFPLAQIAREVGVDRSSVYRVRRGLKGATETAGKVGSLRYTARARVPEAVGAHQPDVIS